MSFHAAGLHARSFKTVRTVSALVLREMATTYGRSPGGYLWAILEPVGGVAILSLAFSMMFTSPALGTNFPLFYATGLLPFMLYSDLAMKLGQALRFSRPLLFYPSVTYLDALIARFCLNGLTQLAVFFIIISGIMTIFDTHSLVDIPAVLNALGMALSLGLGVGTLNSFLLTKFALWERVWVILNRPMFIISSIFFLLESIPAPFRDYLWFNPLVHVIGEMRHGIYPTYDAQWVSPLYVYGVGMSTLLIGLIFLGRYHRELLNS